ncbi:MAG TPA: hypothetical protein VGI46_16760 [Candidatus Acidoferrum sp.]|jgi:hypothetical protein
MKRVRPSSLLSFSLCFFASATFGQITPIVGQQGTAAATTHSITCRASFGPTYVMVAPVTTPPYSAVQESSTVQTLADGTHITRKPMSEKIYRDSQGRSRTERAFCQGLAGAPDGIIVEIRDPVSGYSYILDEQNHVAHRFVLQVRHPTPTTAPAIRNAGPEVVAKTVMPEGALKPTITTESIGSQTTEGVMVEGTRTTRIIPEGLEGNDRPFSIVSETWTSPELQIVVLSKNSDPRNGERTTRLSNIDLSNPILSLFQPPADYKVVDETDRITLTFTRE